MQILQLIWNWSQSTLLSINLSPLAPFSRLKSEKSKRLEMAKIYVFKKNLQNEAALEWISSTTKTDFWTSSSTQSIHTKNIYIPRFSIFSSLSLAKPILLTIISWSCRTWSQIVLSTNSDHQVTIEPKGRHP